MTDVRTLPLRLDVAPGESLDSFIEALARRYRTSPAGMLTILGIPSATHVNTLLSKTTSMTWLRADKAAGLAPGSLSMAAGTRLPAVIRLRSGGSRFCPRCLAESQGRWRLAWRSNWAVACRRHELLLVDLCPVCTAPPRVTVASGTALVPAASCAHVVKDTRRRCGADLTAAAVPKAGDEALEVQAWIDQVMADLTGTAAELAQQVMADLPVVTSWLMRWRFTEFALPRGRTSGIDAAATAAVLATAKRIYANADYGITALREVIACLPRNSRLPPPGLSKEQWVALSSQFTNRFLRAADADLAPTDRMRYLTVTAEAAIPSASTAGRIRFLPQMFWPQPAGRLLPVAGFAPELFRAVMSVCVLIPSAVERKHTGFKTALSPRLSASQISAMLQGFNDLPGGSALTPVLEFLCRLAAYLDDNGAPIDYQRRREQVPAEPILWDRWYELACAANAHPGERGPTGRLLHVQRHLHQLLSGADLADPRHPLAFRDSEDRSRTIAYLAAMPPPLRQALNQYAAELLTGLGIDEPVTWSPPVELTDGLNLPGLDVDGLDADKLRRILIDDQRPARQAAEILGVHLEHIRLAMERLDRPTPNWRPQAAPAAWRREQEAARILTRALFEREYLTARRSLAEIGQATGFTKRMVTRRARALGIPIAPAAPRSLGIDEAWLREQYVTKNRSTADIATEIGANPMTVNRALEHIGIPRRPAGIGSHPHKLAKIDRRYPADIRAAVESSLHGWQRLNRFQIAMAFPSLETAARFLGADQATLVNQFQRLEAEIGSTLFVRGAFGRPHRPTPRGRRLLDALDRQHIKVLMEVALSGRRQQLPDQATLELAAIDAATRKAPGPLQQFDGIKVQRIRVTAATETVLRDLIDHGAERTHGQEIATRTGLDDATVYPNLRRLLAAGWLTSWPEDEQEWLAGAPPGRGPGRRRTYYTLTDDGRRAARHEIERRSRVRETSTRRS